MNLNDRAVLVQLSISQWTARKYDKKATKDVVDANNTTSAAGRFNKALLPMNESLANVHQKATYIRTEFYKNTLPWGIEGAQILPVANYLEFMTKFRKERDDWVYLVNTFVDDYESLKQDAERILGGLYNPEDYPSVEQVRKKFHMDLAVFPVPTNDFRVNIASDELSRIQQDVELRVKQAEKLAMQDVWQRLYDRVKHIADKLADPKAIFRDSMIENAQELCSLLPRLNVMDDPDLEALRQQVEVSLLKHPQSLRNNPELRQDTAAEAKAIMDKMSVFMGGV